MTLGPSSGERMLNGQNPALMLAGISIYHRFRGVENELVNMIESKWEVPEGWTTVDCHPVRRLLEVGLEQLL